MANRPQAVLRFGPNSSRILAATAVLFGGSAAVLAHALVTNYWGGIEWYLRVPETIGLVVAPCIELFYCRRVARSFESHAPLLSGWHWLAASALVSILSMLLSQVVSANTPLNPLRSAAWWAGAAGTLRQLGLLVGGTIRFGCLAAGLACAIRAYRRAGLLVWWSRVDLCWIAVAAAYVALEFYDLAVAMVAGRRPLMFEALSAPTDPLLVLLLAEALLLLRTVRAAGMGRVGRCWAAYSAGILITVLGDVGLWAVTRGYLGWPAMSITWLVWLPAAGAFAAAPAFQQEAIDLAYEPGPRVSPVMASGR